MLAPLDAIRSRGWTTREELLRIGFGGPVPGIAPDPDPCPIPLAINKIAPVRRPNGTEVLGGAAHVRVMPYGKERNLVTRLSALGPLGPLLTYSQENPSLIGHEAVHILQAHDIEITNLVAPHRRAPHVGASLHQGCGPLDPILASEETPLETWRRRRMLRGGVDNARLRLPHLAQAQPYYFKGIEVEARLAQLVFSLAQEEGWTRLPQSRAEAAPLFDRLRPGNAAARLPADPISLQAAEELRDEVAARLSPAQREAFFSQALPAFYADFLERCGDGQAREKMGLSPGIPQGRRAAERMIYEGTLAPGASPAGPGTSGGKPPPWPSRRPSPAWFPWPWKRNTAPPWRPSWTPTGSGPSSPPTPSAPCRSASASASFPPKAAPSCARPGVPPQPPPRPPPAAPADP